MAYFCKQELERRKEESRRQHNVAESITDRYSSLFEISRAFFYRQPNVVEEPAIADT